MGAYTLLQDLTVATNSTSVVLNDFGTITKNDFVKVVVTQINNSGSGTNSSLLANSSVASNYHVQVLRGDGSSASANRASINVVGEVVSGKTETTIGYLKLSQNDRLNIFVNTTKINDSGINTMFLYNTSSGATFPNGITSLTLTGNTNAISTGSRIQIYKLAATKVADFVTTSNSTQVDIPFPTGTFSPAIDKDSEYLLVSDVISTTGLDLNLAVNDIALANNYFWQRIQGNGSAANARRDPNKARIMEIDGAANGINYVHIKLSNIGAYTYQAYSIANQGSSSLRLLNYFGSSTAENITSITKLNIRSGVTNAIGTGSRFILYKLYE